MTVNEKTEKLWNSWRNIYLMYDGCARERGLTFSQFCVMRMVMDDGPCTEKEICEQMRMSKQRISAMLLGLRRRGFVSLQAENRDHRNKDVLLTDAGRKTAEAVILEAEQGMWHFLDGCSEAQAEQLTGMLAELTPAGGK